MSVLCGPLNGTGGWYVRVLRKNRDGRNQWNRNQKRERARARARARATVTCRKSPRCTAGKIEYRLRHPRSGTKGTAQDKVVEAMAA
eukprot:COSAG02_NODE_124_length_35047_cov_31.554179_11_plen_87_part_00